VEVVVVVDRLQQLMTGLAGINLAGDGLPEIVSLAYAGRSAGLGEPDPQRRLVLVLVESRLLTPLIGRTSLVDRLDRLVTDVRREGNDCRLVAAQLYQGGAQKDGWVLLALRRFLQQARDSLGLTAVVLVGRFPEAQILRRFPWAPAFERAISGVATAGRRYLAVDPELVAASADIVLADLTGRWERLYRPAVTTQALYLLPNGADSSTADWLRTGREITGNVVQFDPEITTRDVFYLDEARLQQNLIGPVARVTIDQFRTDPEIAPANAGSANPIALPEIAVSRINAFHVAVRLPADRSLVTGLPGQILDGAITDPQGRPTPSPAPSTTPPNPPPTPRCG
jgi:hypothetical protein